MAIGPIILGSIIMWLVMFLLLSGLLMWLWNITITRIFGIREITYWEAFRLMIIAGLLFQGTPEFKVDF